MRASIRYLKLLSDSNSVQKSKNNFFTVANSSRMSSVGNHPIKNIDETFNGSSNKKNQYQINYLRS